MSEPDETLIAGAARIPLGQRNNIRVARERARLPREIACENGITDEFHTHPYNAEAVHGYEGTQTIHTRILGKAFIGHSTFS